MRPGLLFLLPILMIAAAQSPEKAPRWKAWTLSELRSQQQESGRPYLEFLRVEDLSTGLYVLDTDAEDKQSPHGEDEIYYVLQGKGVIRMDDHDEPVAAGSVIYVKAEVPHKFHSITEQLRILVIFAPPIGSRK